MNRFVISDTHFGHENSIFKFKRPDGSPLRDFKSVEEMDETIVSNWNRVVKPEDKVYHLGDVTMNKKNLPILSRLNGKKLLILGNHDDHTTAKGWLEYFYDVQAIHYYDKFIMTHIPIHPDSLGKFKNIHGHVHEKLVRHTDGTYDNRYINVCVEQIGYTPLSMDDLLKGWTNE